MAIASANAAPINIGTKSFPVDSGFRPIDSMAFATMLPIASAGAKPPMAIVAPLTIILMDSASIVFRISVDREVGFKVAESPWLRMSAAARLFPDESPSRP